MQTIIEHFRSRVADLVVQDKNIQKVFDFSGKEGEIVQIRGEKIECRNVEEWAELIRQDGAW